MEADLAAEATVLDIRRVLDHVAVVAVVAATHQVAVQEAQVQDQVQAVADPEEAVINFVT